MNLSERGRAPARPGLRAQPIGRPALLAALCGLALATERAALADEAAPSWQVTDEIVVTGRQADGYAAQQASVLRSEIPIVDWPQSVQVLNRTLIEEQNAQSLTEILVNVSGVVPNHEQETVLVNPFVRGLEAEIYLDGLVGYGDTAVLDPSSLAVIERVEVAKGATSALFGGGVGAPTGGLINLVTKTPGPDTGYGFSLESGSFGTRAVTADLNRTFGGAAGVRLAAEWYRSDDMIDAVDIDRLTLNPSLSFAVGDATDVVLRGFHNRIEQLEYTGLPAEVANLPGVDRNQFSGAVNAPRTEIENTSLHATVGHRFSPSLSGQLQLRYFENSFDEYSSFPFLSFFPIQGTSVPIIRGSLPVDTDELTADASLTYLLDNGGPIRHNLLAGVTWDATDYRAGSGFDFAPIGVLDYAGGVNTLDFGPIPPINSFVENEYRTWAVYLQDHISIAGRWHILLSGRFSRYGLTETVGGTGADETYDEFDPRIGVTYNVTESVSAFAGYATGSRIVPFFTGVNSRAPVPEESESHEAGIKIAAGEITATLAAFELERSRIPETDLTDPFFGSVQTGEQKSRGVELDLIWEPGANLSVLMNAAYIAAETAADIASFGGVIPKGTQLSRIPEKSGRIAARYRFAAGPLSGLGVGLGMTYADEAPLTDSNLFFSDPYTVFDLQADYDFGPLYLKVNVVNLTDKSYFKPYQYLLQEVVRPGQERSAYINLGVRL